MLNTKKQSQFNNDFQPQIGYGLHINKNPHHGGNLPALPLRGQILPEPLILFFGKNCIGISLTLECPTM